MSQEKSYSSGSHKRSRLVRTLSQELENIITLDEIKEDISCWKKLLETFWKKRESGNQKTYFDKICGMDSFICINFSLKER